MFQSLVVGLVAFCLCFGFGPATSWAQEAQKVLDSEAPDEFFLLDATGSVKQLERVTTHEEKHGSIRYMTVSGEHSNVVVPYGQNLNFVVRVSSKQFDSQSAVQFFRLTREEHERRIELTVGKTVTEPIASIGFEAAKYSEGSFEVKPKAQLATGEYILLLSNSKAHEGFCFSVGVPSKK